MFPLRPRLALLLVPLAAAACGGASTSGPAHTDPLHAVLLSAQKVGATSFAMSMSMTEHITAPGSLGAAMPSAITITGTAHAASPQRMSMSMSMGLGASNISVLEVAYDGTSYTSTDNGASWKTLNINTGALTQTGPAQALELLQDVGTVTDAGPSTVNGQPVETYHAVIDPAKMQALMTKMFASVFSGSRLGSYTSAITSALAIKTSTIDLAVNSAGLPLRETESVDVSLDLAKLAAAIGAPASSSSSLTGAMDVVIDGTFTFSDFGKPVTVTKPTNVIGTLGG